MNRGPLRRFVDAWTRLSEAQQEGRLYECAGLLPLFRLVAALFGEELPDLFVIDERACFLRACELADHAV